MPQRATWCRAECSRASDGLGCPAASETGTQSSAGALAGRLSSRRRGADQARGTSVVGRWPDLFGPARLAPFAANLLLFAGAVHDKVTRGRIHPVSVWVPLALIAVTLFAAAVALSAPSREFAAWLAGYHPHQFS